MHSVPAADYADLRALHWISRFGWLRSRELGAVLWPAPTSTTGEPLVGEAKEETQRWMANRILRRLREQKWVLERHLPKSGGRAHVLSASGARHLQRGFNTQARPGDKWGRVQGGTWIAPSQWEHELLVTILLVQAIADGCEVKTEIEIRAENENKKLRKYPDGLISYWAPNPHTKALEHVVQWLEVESADKSGAYMLSLARALLRVTRHEAPRLCGWDPNMSIVAYRDDMLSPSGKPVNHRLRITNAIKRHIFADMTVYFQEVTVRNLAYHVDHREPQGFVIEPIDLDDPTPLANRCFTAIAHKTFINQQVDSKDNIWTLKVYADAGRYRLEIWDSEKPDYKNGEPDYGYYSEDIEQAFRKAISTWRQRFSIRK